MTKEGKLTMKRLPRGEAALPLLAVVLFVLLFVAWPLVDFGLLIRPFPGMAFLIVTLSGLYAFGTHGRALTSILALGGAVFVLQALVLVWDFKAISILNEVAAELFFIGALWSITERRDETGTGHCKPHRRRCCCIRALRAAIRLPLRPSRALLPRGLHSGAGVAYVYLDGLALLLSLDDNTQFAGPERHHANTPLRSIAGDVGGIARSDVHDHFAGAPCLTGSR
jgi:hypothetical protein